jgi:hypothetical protein
MDGKPGEVIRVETGFPQRSSVSPIFFVIYIANLAKM